GNRNAQESARIQNATSLQCQRACCLAWRPTSACAVMADSTGGGAAEQAVRAPDQDHDHDGVDDERSELRTVVFAGDVADTEQQSSQDWPCDDVGDAVST